MVWFGFVTSEALAHRSGLPKLIMGLVESQAGHSFNLAPRVGVCK